MHESMFLLAWTATLPLTPSRQRDGGQISVISTIPYKTSNFAKVSASIWPGGEMGIQIFVGFRFAGRVSGWWRNIFTFKFQVIARKFGRMCRKSLRTGADFGLIRASQRCGRHIG